MGKQVNGSVVSFKCRIGPTKYLKQLTSIILFLLSSNILYLIEKCPGKDFNYCKNGGTLDPNTCRCRCDSTWIGQRCEKYGK